MSMVPTTKRRGPGQYRMHSGDEYVDIYRCRDIWAARPKGDPNKFGFPTKREASEYAFDWLTEHA